MSEKKFYGLTTCPTCGYDRARVTATKSGGTVMYCPNENFKGMGIKCGRQILSHKRHLIEAQIASVRPGTGDAAAVPLPQPQPQPQPEPAAPAKTAPPAVPEPQPKPKPTGNTLPGFF